jgi:hypothetical protein
LLAAWPAGASGPADSVTGELDALKKRVAELESQNRRMAEQLAALEALLRPAQPAPAAAAAVPAPVKSVVQPATPVRTAQPAENSKAGNGEAAPSLKFYGMMRLDIDIDTQRPNSPQAPLFISSPSGGEGGSFAMHPRLTRFGVDLTGPRVSALGGAALSGKLETDFENGGSESRQIIRIRHAYLKSSWKDFSLLAGQTWDVFSPLFPTVNNDTLMWTAGNLGDRRPQLRAAYEPKAGKGQLSFAGAIGVTGVVDALDLDGNGYADGIQSARPDVQWRVGYSRPSWVGGQAFALGGSMFHGWLGVTRPIGGKTLLAADGYNADLTLPLTHALTFRGEGWWGRNMSDFRGGAGQGINAAAGRVVRGRGGWAELQLRINRYWLVAPGFTTDNPVKADLAAGSRSRNRAFYIANRFTLGGKLETGFDYLRWRTDYLGLLPGFDNRFNIFFQYGF